MIDDRIGSDTGDAPNSPVNDPREIERRLDAFWDLKPGRPSVALAKDVWQGRKVGQFRIEEWIGAGAFGVVYRAWDERLERHVAIKFPRADLLTDRDTLRRFESEAAANARLQHPAIMPVYEAQLSGESPYIVSALCKGPDLAQWLNRRMVAKIDEKEIVGFVLELVRGLEYAHQQGVIHRDIKPSNIMMELSLPGSDPDRISSFQPRITDFGLAKLTDRALTDSRSSMVIGTPIYMAPEQLLPNWGKVSERTDIFAIGVLLYELLEGKPPRSGKSYAEILQSLMDPRVGGRHRWERKHSRSIRTIVDRCLQIDPLDRYESAGKLARELASSCSTADADCRSSVTWSSGWSGFKRWARNPRRPLEVCSFVIPINLIMFVWMIVNACLIESSVYHGDQRHADLIQCLGIAFGYNLVVAGLCGLRAIGYRWATWVAIPLTLFVTVSVPLLTAAGLLQTFHGLYAQAPFFRMANHAQILIIGLFEILALSISAYSDWSRGRREFT